MTAALLLTIRSQAQGGSTGNAAADTRAGKTTDRHGVVPWWLLRVRRAKGGSFDQGRIFPRIKVLQIFVVAEE
jgi:hypothetical protein